MEQWKAIPVNELEAIEAEFKEVMGDRYELLAVQTYHQHPMGSASA